MDIRHNYSVISEREASRFEARISGTCQVGTWSKRNYHVSFVLVLSLKSDKMSVMLTKFESKSNRVKGTHTSSLKRDQETILNGISARFGLSSDAAAASGLASQW